MQCVSGLNNKFVVVVAVVPDAELLPKEIFGKLHIFDKLFVS